MIRWLGIHYKFPPVATVSSRRLFLLYQALSQLTEAQVVVTSAEAAKRPAESAYRHDIRLAPVGGRGLREWLYGAKYNVVPAAHKQRPGYHTMVRLRETSPFDNWLGEGGPAYRRRAFRRAVQLVEEENITHLFSSFRPWADHQVADRLKRSFPHLYWIADFRDLPLDPLRNPPYGQARHERILRKRLARVDELWTVSEGLAARLRAYHHNVKVVYGGLDTLPEPTDYQSDRFTINYGGSIYSGLQDLNPLLTSLERLAKRKAIDPSRILIRYAGRDRSRFAEQLAETNLPIASELYEVLPLVQAKSFQRETHLNLLLSWATDDYHGVLTAKLYDYLAAGRPILAMIKGKEDLELKRIIEQSGAGQVFTSEKGFGSANFNRRSGSSDRPAEVQKGRADFSGIRSKISPDADRLDHWLASIYEKWQASNGRLPWQTQGAYLLDLQPVQILRRVLNC